LVGARANDPALRPTPTPAAGTNPATPAASPTPASTPFFGDQRKQSTTNWEIDKTIRRTVGNGGVLKRLSAAVIVDHKLVDNTQAPRSPEELKTLQDTISAAIGIDTQRGDQLVVQSLAFERAPAEAAANLPWWEKFHDLIKLGIKYGLLVFAALLLIFFGFRPLRRSLAAISKRGELTEAQIRALPSMQTVSELAANSRMGNEEANRLSDANHQQSSNALPRPNEKMKDEGPHLTVAEIEAQMQAEIEHELATQAAPVVKRASAIKKTLVERTQKDPETIAVTIRSWLKDKEAR
ncbi:MAG TPA: flagellar M-ring protein FliF C-terminal domain-containing protein, partial [Blastocatellia bacterium]|nr:flagellar M-ring protein FliF C-terminal domain-containing protein [Blastocatellia bacterium]